MGLLSKLFGGQTQGSSTVNAPDSVWGAQAPFLQGLFGSAAGLAGQQAGQIGQAASQTSQQLLGGLGPYGQASTNPAFANLLQRAQGGSPFLDQQIQGLGQDIGQFYNQQILPGIAGQATGYGQTGLSRQSLAEGLAGQQALREFGQGATNLRQADYGQGLQAALGLGDLSGQAVSGLGSLYSLAMSPFSAQWAPWSAYSGILGSPTVLGGGGTSTSKGQLDAGIFQPIKLFGG